MAAVEAALPQPHVSENDVFVDVGSGMGRVLLMAARRPFKRVIGIERSAELNRIARRILERRRHRLACRDVELHSIDAREWEVPDDLSVVYLFCPFPAEVFAQLVESLIASIDRSPRHLRLIYKGTSESREVLLSTGRAEQISLPVPWYLRSRFEGLSMFRLLQTHEASPD